MKKLSLLIVVALAAASLAMAANSVPTPNWGSDVLGAHNGYGRGCVMCHAPHSGSLGNGAGVASGTGSDSQNGMVALWGQNLTPLYGKTFSFAGDTNSSRYPVTLPAAGTLTSSFTEGSTIILFCLSCHDGVTAVVSMMQGQTVETLPVVGGHAPTLLATAAPSGGWAYANDHPVGPNAFVGCGGGYNWDCTGGGNTQQPIEMNGPASSAFLTNNPSSFWNAESCTSSTANSWGYTCSRNPLATFSSTGTVNNVTCTTCHNQHSMTVWSVTKNNVTTNYPTMFFIKGHYNPSSGGNSVAQFCRNCHGGASNEMGGLMSVPTT